MLLDIKIAKEKCIEKWKSGFDVDQKIINASENFETWLSQIPNEYKEISTVLIQNLEYYSRNSTNKWLEDLHKKLIQIPTVTEENTIYAFIKSKDGKSNSSNDYWSEYKSLNNINLELCYENMDAIYDYQWKYIDNIIFIDDFSGSAKSFIDELKKHEERYNGKDIYFLTINMMEFAINQIEEYATMKNLNIILIFAFTQKKTFEREFFENNIIAKSSIIELSQQLGIPAKERLGFEESQSLIAFHNNTPNNTLGFVRYDTDTYQSLFPRRHSKKPSWQTMKQNKRNRKKANYNNKIRG